MKYTALVLAFYGVALVGCGGVQDVGGFSVRDSAGVQLIEMSGTFAANVLDLTLHEDLRIGAIDGPPELEFARILHLAEGVDGSVYVADAGNHVVRKFSPEGDFEFEFGGVGEGPGRFTGPWYLSLIVDTIVTVDRLIQAFDPDGELIEAVGPDLLGRNPNVWELDVTDAGWLVQTRSTFADDMRRAGPSTNREATGPFADTTYIEQFDPATGARGTTIFAYPRETWHRLHGAFHVVPFLEPTPYHKVSGDGRIHFARGGRYKIETWTPLDAIERPGMRLARRITANVPLLPRTKELEDMHLEVQRERFANRPSGGEFAISRQIQMEDVLELPGPDHRPVIGRLFVSPGGETIVERLDLDEEPFRTDNPTVWDLISVDGLIKGRLTLSERFTPRAFTSRGLLGVLRDEFDVQYVVRYRIEKRN
jgi:hypothetical protein